MKMEKLDLDKHNTLKVAELIYETDTDLFNFLFRNKQNTARKVEKLVRAGKNTLGHERIMVVTENDDDQVLGVLVYSCGRESDQMDELKVLRQNFNLWDVFKFAFMDWWDGHFLSDLNEDDFYLACVAVDENTRGRGVGTFILEQAKQIGREYCFKRAVLDVILDNEGAYKLYKRRGFEVFNKKSIPWIGGEKGAFNMEFKLE